MTIEISLAIALSVTYLADVKPSSEPERLATFMVGSFSSQEQSEKEKDFFDVRLQMVRIWKDRPNEIWLYVEQAMANALDKPYRQRVYKIEAKPDGKLLSRVFDLPGEAIRFAGEWRKETPLAELTPDKLAEKSGCAIILTKRSDGTYAGSTEGKGCASNLRGAAYATSEVKVSAETLSSWDRGYDKEGKQVWGAVKGPYVFKRVKK